MPFYNSKSDEELVVWDFNILPTFPGDEGGSTRSEGGGPSSRNGLRGSGLGARAKGNCTAFGRCAGGTGEGMGIDTGIC